MALEPMLKAAQDRGMKLRTRLVAGFFALVCFGGLAARLWYIQITDHDFYAGRASGQQLRDTVVPAPRGDIVDTNGVPLAVNATCWTIRASPREMADEDVEPASRALAPLVGMEYEELYGILSQRSSNDALLLRRADRETADAVRQLCAENGWEGILLLEDTKRWYPEGDFAASLLGFTNVDNAGMAGLELEYDQQLTGTSGRVLSAKNAWGYDMPTGYDTYIPPVQGNTLQLTIDVNVQHYLENYLSYAVKAYNVSQRAVGIVMEVDTGRVLAIATKPDYDPNEPRVLADEEARALVDSLSGEERSAALQLAQQTQWRNKAVSDLYEPGSVFKLITCAAALDTGAVTPSSTFYCGEAYKVAGIAFHCANHKSHGNQTVAQALANSCNQSFIQIGQRLGVQDFCDYFEAFGLQGATGIDLPAEPKKSEYYTADRMGPVELASCSFGQSSKVSYLQMITAVCAVVNGGKLMQPHVVQSIRDTERNTVQQVQPTVKAQVIRPETSAVMRELMEGVVTTGTGKNGAVAGYRVGGKTGTSQKLDSENERARIASFVAVTPIENPKIAVLICLDEPHSWTTSGGALSGPVAAEVLQKSLPRLGIQPSYTEAEQAKYFTTVPDVTGWKAPAAAQKLNEYTLTADVLGQGERVVSQYPRAGTTVRRGSAIQLDTTGQLDPAADEG